MAILDILTSAIRLAISLEAAENAISSTVLNTLPTTSIGDYADLLVTISSYYEQVKPTATLSLPTVTVYPLPTKPVSTTLHALLHISTDSSSSFYDSSLTTLQDTLRSRTLETAGCHTLTSTGNTLTTLTSFSKFTTTTSLPSQPQSSYITTTTSAAYFTTASSSISTMQSAMTTRPNDSPTVTQLTVNTSPSVAITVPTLHTDPETDGEITVTTMPPDVTRNKPGALAPLPFNAPSRVQASSAGSVNQYPNTVSGFQHSSS